MAVDAPAHAPAQAPWDAVCGAARGVCGAARGVCGAARGAVYDAPCPAARRQCWRWIVARVAIAMLAAALTAAAGAPTAAAAPASEMGGGPRPQAGPTISTTGGCPGAETLWTAMTALVPRGALESLPRAAVIDVADLGETYRVRLTTGGVERVRVYRDLARDCDQRARFAAVFVVLTLLPPELLIDSPTPLLEPETTVTSPRPPPVAGALLEPPPRPLRLELSALGDAAPAMLSAPGVSSPGVALRAAIGRGALIGVLGVALQASSTFTVGPLRARERRIPVEAGARLRHAGRWLEVGGELGLCAAYFRAEGLSPVVARAASGVDLGVRAGATLRVGPRAARLAPIAGVHGDYFPRPYDLSMQPNGVVGKTPTFRFGATAGLAASF